MLINQFIMAVNKKQKDKEKSGRPRIIPQKWNEELKKKLLDSYKQGGSDIVAIAELDITRETFYRILRSDNENLEPIEIDFLDTIKKGNVLSQLWFEEKGRKGMIGAIDNFNNGAFVFHMKNRFRKGGFDGSWADKQDLIGITNPADKVNIEFNLTKE
jgi:hypothetical protein